MRKYFYLSLLLCIVTFIKVYTQNLIINAGRCISYLQYQSDQVNQNTKIKLGHYWGFSLEGNIDGNEKWYCELGGRVIEKGAKTRDFGFLNSIGKANNYTLKTFYFQIPLLTRYRIRHHSISFRISAGPILNFKASGIIEHHNKGASKQRVHWGKDLNKHLKAFDLGVVSGIGIEWRGWFLECSHEIGLTNMYPAPYAKLKNATLKNRTFYITIGLQGKIFHD